MTQAQGGHQCALEAFERYRTGRNWSRLFLSIFVIDKTLSINGFRGTWPKKQPPVRGGQRLPQADSCQRLAEVLPGEARPWIHTLALVVGPFRD